MALPLDDLDAVLFDLDDTLVDWRGASREALEHVLRACLEPAGVAPEQARSQWAAVVEENMAAFRETGRWWTPRDRFRRLGERLGRDGSVDAEACAEEFVAAARRALRPLDGSVGLLGWLHGAGLRVGLLTNGPAEVQRPKVDALPFLDRFHHVSISGETGAWKPDAQAFRGALAGLDAVPGRCAMVGDSLHFDIVPARTLGLRTVWVDRDGAARGGEADVVVPGPGGLLRMLR